MKKNIVFFIWTCIVKCCLLFLIWLPAVAKDISMFYGNRVAGLPQHAISGTVKSDKGVVLEGVTVNIKGTDIRTSTNAEGQFTINEVAPGSTLVFTSVGYSLVEVEVTEQSTMNVTMHGDVAGLDEVVVVGYGTMKKSDLTGSVHQVSATELRDQSSVQLTDMLAGTVAGLRSNQGTEAAGGGSMLIRGQNSIRASTAPMIVLDGVVFNGEISDINPNDIETIDILKDASSAAVFGARAASGVILITTKKGVLGKPTINMVMKQGLAKATSTDYAYRSPQEYVDFRRDYLRTLWGSQPDYYFHNPQDLPSGVTLDEWRTASNNPNPNDTLEWLNRLEFFDIEVDNYLNNQQADWLGEVMQTGHRQEYDISIRGGSDKTTYFWSLGYLDNEGIIRGDHFSTVRSKLNLEMNVNDWLNIGLNTNYSYRDQSGVPASLGNLYQASPFGAIYNDDGSVKFYPHEYINQNPLINTLGQVRDNSIHSLFASLYGEVTLPFGIKYRISFQPRSRFQRTYDFWGSETIIGTETYPNGRAERADNTYFEWMVDNLLTWNKTFGVHNFDVTLLYNAEQFKAWRSNSANQNFQPSPNLGYHGLQFGDNPFVSNNDTKLTGDGLMARLNYNLMDKYLLTASIRRDGFSAFGQRNPYGVFPAAAFAWQAHNENFFNADFVNQMKFRVSWGVNGNREIGTYAAFAEISSTPYYDGSGQQVGIFTSSLSNTELSWEETASLNFGADMAFFDNRISLTVDYYDSKTTRLLMQRTLPSITGFNNVMANIGGLANKGFEMTASSLNINTSDFSWRSTLSFALNRNRITRLFGETGTYTLLGETHTGELPDFANQWFIGKQLDAVWDYNILGVWQMHEGDEAAQYGLQPGDYKVEDVNDDEVYEALQDKQFIGHTLPRYTLGLRNEFSFLNNFTATIFLRADLGHIRNFSPSIAGYSTYNRRNTANFPYWTPENESNDYPRLGNNHTVYGGNLMPYKSSSFLRVQDVTLAYSLPARVAQQLRVGSARFSFSARNPVTFSNWDGWDPESGFNPMPKIYTMGLDFSL